MLHQDLHIDPDILFGGGVAEQVGRMIGDQHLSTAIGVKAAAELADGHGGVEQGVSGRCSQAADELGLQNFQLAFEIGTTVFRFDSRRHSITRRAAFEHIQNVKVLSTQSHRGDDFIE